MSGPEPTLSIRRALRRATADAHRRLDDLVTTQDPFSSLDAYRDFLDCHRSARARVREQAGGLGPDERWAELQSGDDLALSQDLEALGVPVGSRRAVPGRPPVAESADVGRGVLYVLEGSKLGARVLRAQLNDRLGHRTPQSFLATGDPQRWADTCRELEASQDLAAVIDAARWTFDVFADAFASRSVRA